MNTGWKERLGVDNRMASTAMPPVSPKGILLGELWELCEMIE